MIIMRPSSLFNSQLLVITIQTLTCLWFLFQFFLVRDSLTVNSVWQSKRLQEQPFRHQLHQLHQETKSKLSCNSSITLSKPVFDKLIFVIVDALGYEFLPSLNNGTVGDEHMPFLEDLIQKKHALAFNGRAATPTVTMPRIKALTSGTIPSFVDIMYNLASDVSKFEDDNIIRLAKTSGKSIVFYGDDTWLLLFNSSIFKRFKETHSFFASDYTTVDTNVTNPAMEETNKNPIDWDYLFLHYLGLDHIGHVFGSNSGPLIKKKLLEMDKVIKKFYNNMRNKDHKTLVVVCGDHGMSPEGNHGGDTKLEVETLMAFIPVNVDINRHQIREGQDNKVKQVDMAVSLAELLGLPIPIKSRGVGIDGLLSAFLIPDRMKCFALENLIQLSNLVDFNSYPQEGQDELIEVIEKYDSDDMFYVRKLQSVSKKIQNHLLENMTSNSNLKTVGLMTVFMTGVTLIALQKCSSKLLRASIYRNETLFCFIIMIIPILMQGSTDYIEAEGIFWPCFNFLVASLTFSYPILLQSALPKNIDHVRVILLITTTILTTLWNRTTIHRESNFAPKLATLFLCNSLRQNNDFSKKYKHISFITIGIIILALKHFEDCQDVESPIILQRIALLIVILYNLANFLSKSEEYQTNPPVTTQRLIGKCASAWMLLGLLLGRKHNFTFFMANILMESSINYLVDFFKLTTCTRSLIYMSFAQMAFYNQGNSNLFTTIDVKPAFYGQSEYNFTLGIILVSLNTYSAQIYWYIKLLQRSYLEGTAKQLVGFINSTNFLSLSYYMFVCIVLQNHLFIWSVISPKLIYHVVTNYAILFTTYIVLLITELLDQTNVKKSENKLAP